MQTSLKKMAKINSEDFLVCPDHNKVIDLDKWPTRVEPYYESEDKYEQIIKTHVKEMGSLQTLLYASNKYSILIIFQALDAAGKDSAIKHVMSGVNPQGCHVYSFKHPSQTEQEHDFLWRTTAYLPERGKIGIFNRSYYEEVLIVRVHPEILQSEGVTYESIIDLQQIWQDRYRSIRDLEAHLHRNGTRIIKFFLHISKDKQRERFLKRIDDPEKNWKLSTADVEERKFWRDYVKAYEDCLSYTSTTDSPWYIVPADDKENTHVIVSHIILDTLKGLKMSYYPKLSPQRKEELQRLRKALSE